MTYPLFVACGAAAGVLAGLLGVGGGLVIVPFLLLVAPGLGVADDMLAQTVVATSLASMVPITFAAAWAQHRRGDLDVPMACRFLPGLSIGIGGMALVSSHVAMPPLMTAFGAYALWCGTRMLMGPVPAAVTHPCVEPHRTQASLHLTATILGVASATAGLGGAFISVPYLLRQGLPLRRVLATSSAISFMVCVEGSLAYVWLCPAGAQAGAVLWPAAATIGLAAAAAAPLGVALARRAPVSLLRRLFGAVSIASALLALAS